MMLYPERTNLLLAGPSNAGLADPGHGTAISLFQITTTLLATEANIDRLVICHFMIKLVDEIGDAFLAAHRKRVKHTSAAAAQAIPADGLNRGDQVPIEGVLPADRMKVRIMTIL